MADYRDLLPNRKSYCRGAGIVWCPCRERLEIQTHPVKIRCYRVHELKIDPVHFGGRAFKLDKLTPGSDHEADGYATLLGDDPRNDSCECKGFLRHGHCCHLDALRTMKLNGWLDLPHPAKECPEPDAPAHEPFEDCPACNGTGTADGNPLSVDWCPVCRGSGAKEVGYELPAITPDNPLDLPDCFRGLVGPWEGVPF